MILNSSCVHWWTIDNFSLAHCKKCGEIRDFKKVTQEEKLKKTIHKKTG